MYTRKQLLDGMCLCAEGQITCLDESNSIQKAFKPGVGDKFIFNMILTAAFNQITREYEREKSHVNSNQVAMNLMTKLYYPDYGFFDKEQDRGARR